MKKKYTMKEFEEMYERAEAEALEELTKKMEETGKEKGHNFSGLETMAFGLQNIMAYAVLKGKLFYNEEK